MSEPQFECPRCGHCCLQQTEQEPVAWVTRGKLTMIRADAVTLDDTSIPLYVAPPKREWVGLTLNEAKDFYEKYPDRVELINAIDKFLEEKNNG